MSPRVLVVDDEADLVASYERLLRRRGYGDRRRPWIVLAFILIAVAYGPTLLRLATMTQLNAPGMRVW